MRGALQKMPIIKAPGEVLLILWSPFHSMLTFSKLIFLNEYSKGGHKNA